MTIKNAALQRQIDEKRKQIHTDQYSISIGELANLYKDGEIDIHPEFQIDEEEFVSLHQGTLEVVDEFKSQLIKRVDEKAYRMTNKN